LLRSRLLVRHYRFATYCLRKCDEQRDAAQCLAFYQDGLSSKILLIPILVSQTKLRRLLGSRLIQYHYRFVAYCCLCTCDEQRDAAQCLACHQDDGISSELLHNPILVSQTRLRRLLGSRLLLHHYGFIAYCLRNGDEVAEGRRLVPRLPLRRWYFIFDGILPGTALTSSSQNRPSRDPPDTPLVECWRSDTTRDMRA